MRTLLFAAIVGLFSIFSTQAMAVTDLIMVYSPKCIFCMRFEQEVLPEYRYEIRDGKILTLKIFDVSKKTNVDWLLGQIERGSINPIRGTPTFILYDGWKEIARIEGYRGKDWFYNELDRITRENNLH